MTATAFVDARLLDPASGLDETGVLVARDGAIEALGATVPVPEGAEVVDCAGHLLAPGLIDMRSFAADARSAAAGGVTTAVLMPDGNPVTDNDALVQHLTRGPAAVRIATMGAATKALAGQEIAEIGLMAEAGAVGFTDGRRAVANAGVMRRLLEYSRLFDALIVQHVEEPGLVNGGAMNEGEVATRLGLGGIPVAAETIMIERDMRLVALTGGRYHAAQLSSAEAVDIVRGAKKAGLPVTCGVTPHHLTLNETAVGDYRTFAKTSPPLRREADREALVAGLADGTVDIICSSHDPHDQDAKRLPFAQAADGIVGYETLLPLALALHHKGDVPLAAVLKALTATPAALLGLPSGRLAAGAPADLVLIDLDAPWRIDVDAFASPTKNSPFDGLPVQGRVLRTVVGGRTVFARGD